MDIVTVISRTKRRRLASAYNYFMRLRSWYETGPDQVDSLLATACGYYDVAKEDILAYADSVQLLKEIIGEI